MFRLVLDLSCFFHNHKRKARIFVKESIKTVADLQRRIAEVFGVDNFELYASDGHCYLPPLEDVRVLRDDEVVSVIPNNKSKHQIEPSCEPPPVTVLEKPKKSKRVLESIAEEHSEELTSPKKKKHKEQEILITSEDETPKRKKKNKHSKESQSNNSFEKIPHKKSKSNEKPKSLGALLPTLRSHINSCDKTGRPASHGAIPADSSLIRLSNHVSTPYKKFKKFEPIPLITDDVLNKKQINIVKIDIIKQGGEVQINEKNNKAAGDTGEGINSFSTPKENFVKKVVNYNEHENTLSPENVLPSKPTNENFNSSISLEKSADSSVFSQEEKSSKADLEMDVDLKVPAQEKGHTRTSLWSISLKDSKDHTFLETKIDEVNTSQTEFTNENPKKSVSFLLADDLKNITRNSVQSDLSTTEEKVENKSKTPINITDTLEASNFLKPKLSELSKKNVGISSFSINQLNHESFDFSLNKSSDIELNSFSTTNGSVENLSSEPPEPEKKNFFYMKRKFAGVAAYLDQLKDSDVDQNASKTDSKSNNFVTKRHRKRLRHRRSNKSRDHSDASTSDASFVKEEYIPRPMNVSACPKIHMKFDDGEISSENPLDLISQTEFKKQPIERQKTEEKQLTDKSNFAAEAVFSEDTILKSPIMLQLDPKQGDVIAFKMLIMKNFTPLISQYFVGRVLDFSNDKIVKMEILSGNSKDLIDEGQEDSKVKSCVWQKLIAPRLIFP